MARKLGLRETKLIEQTIRALQSSSNVPADARRLASRLLAEMLTPSTKAGRKPVLYEAKLEADASRYFEFNKARSKDGLSYEAAIEELASAANQSTKAIEKSIAEFAQQADYRGKVTIEQWLAIFTASERFSADPQTQSAENNIRLAAFEAVNYAWAERYPLDERIKTSGRSEYLDLVSRCIEHAASHILHAEFPAERRPKLRSDARAMAIHYALTALRK